ncbi:MAG: acetate uptake transporter [Ktedonobacterales bacterium]
MSETKAANPGPLGLSGFAVTTFVLSLVNANVIKGTETGIVIGLAVFYGGIAQFAAGMWEFRAGNTFGATAFTTYGAFWLSFAAILIPGFGANLKASSADRALGFYVLAWAIVTGILTLGALRLNGALSTVFVLLFVTFLALALGYFTTKATATGPNGWTKLGGWLGILTAIAAWYTAMAGILESASGGAVMLPTFRPVLRVPERVAARR